MIVDEVHERAIMTDFALAILRDLLVHRPDVRLVLVSIPYPNPNPNPQP